MHVLAPLVHTTSVVYAKDKKVLKILVQSPTPVLNMTLITSITDARDKHVLRNEKATVLCPLAPAPIDTNDYWDRPISVEGGTSGDDWELLLLFDSEHSCHLANEHIRTTR